MSAVFIRRISNLSKLVGEKGGKTVLAALKAAEIETAPLREEGRALLAEAVTALETAAGDPWGETWLDDIYSASAGIIDICPPDLPAVKQDAGKLRQVLSNLVSNAVKFTPEGGRVTLSAAVADGQLVLTVADTGVGIAEEEQDLVFDKFRQASNPLTREQGGTGLGL